MRSSTGKHYLGLDHVRAVAAFLVWTWHFVHAAGVPWEYSPAVPFLSLLSEGHTGVAVFMALSGYLFAKLLDGRRIRYAPFFWNRMLRLVPLLVVVVVLEGFRLTRGDLTWVEYLAPKLQGFWKPNLPNGGWSITVEFHFYLMLPLLLWMARKSNSLLLAAVLVMPGVRYLIYDSRGEVHLLAYQTIVGRLDQFLLGILAYQWRRHIVGRHGLVLAVFTAFACFWWHFDAQGGWWRNVGVPSPSPMWVYLTTLEGVAYATVIAWYDGSFEQKGGWLSRLVARMGQYSYSTYLLHFFIVFHLGLYLRGPIPELSNFYLALLFGALCYPIMFPIGYLSFRFVEAPFLRLRRKYVIESEEPSGPEGDEKAESPPAAPPGATP